MDADRFDALARSLTLVPPRPSRRALLRTLGGGALAGLLAPLAGEEAGAKKKKGCKASEKKCGNRCIPKGDCCKNADCSLCRDEVCTRGRCGCEPGAFYHNGVCGTPPVCQVVGEICASDGDCCSGHCNVVSDNGVTTRCNRGITRCVTDFDCDPGFACRGFSCTSNPPCP